MSEDITPPASRRATTASSRIVGTVLGGIVGAVAGLAALAAGAALLEVEFFSAKDRVTPLAYVLASAGGWALAGFLAAGLVRRWPATAFIAVLLLAVSASQALAVQSTSVTELAPLYFLAALVFAPLWPPLPLWPSCAAVWVIATRRIAALLRDRPPGSQAGADLLVAGTLGFLFWLAPLIATLN
jgi:hypothetical protein